MPRGKRRSGAGRRGRPSAIAKIPTSALKQELERRQSALHDLIRQRDELTAELQELESVFGPNATSITKTMDVRRGPGRPKGSSRQTGSRKATGLVESLRRVLNGKTLSVSEVSDAVQKAGYKTKSSNFRVIVNQALLANRSAFKKVARGQYTAK